MCDRSTTCTAIYGTHRMRTYISYQPPTNASLAGNLIAHCSQLSFISLLNREPHILPWVRGAGGSFGVILAYLVGSDQVERCSSFTFYPENQKYILSYLLDMIISLTSSDFPLVVMRALFAFS